MADLVQIVDLFAGPGGLGEGFTRFKESGESKFAISISIEKDKFAYQTLLLRSFYRQFESTPQEYYEYLKGKIDVEDLYNVYPKQYEAAFSEAWCAELGHDNFPHKVVAKKIVNKLDDGAETIVIGGPPCQAYSLVGRSKMSKREGFSNDPRHTLYQEYLKIIAEVRPAVFVMENVKGMVSSKANGQYIFDKILEDLRTPALILKPNKQRFRKTDKYTIYSLVSDVAPNELTRHDFTIKCEEMGIPQARHRVILMGVRNDISVRPEILEKTLKKTSIFDVIDDLPKLRSGLSKQEDSKKAWVHEIIKTFPEANVYKHLSRGGAYIPHDTEPKVNKEWYVDSKLGGVINHETRAHIATDLHRYYFISNFGLKNKYSPKLADLPNWLLPKHKNVHRAISGKNIFNDRFRVQLKNKPATTITSHISKDGHYFIHYDKRQCRSLTVREAARIQTFPDNYKFEGPRTSQYQQVGNAVPPLLAYRIAKIVYQLLEEVKLSELNDARAS